MNKLLAFIFLVLLSPFIGSLYGIIHDQITFTLSNEYYTKFKFIQFGLAENGQIISSPRMLVSIVGIMATWWMGLIIGSILGLTSLMLRNGKEMIKITINAIFITIILAFAIGVIGYIYGKFSLASENLSLNLPEDLINKSDFVAVGSMHNFSYIGGLIGLICGIIYIVKQKRKENAL